jgi:hypothetical protein
MNNLDRSNLLFLRRAPLLVLDIMPRSLDLSYLDGSLNRKGQESLGC